MPLAPPIDAIQQPAVGIYGLPVGASAGAMVLLTAAQIRAHAALGTLATQDGTFSGTSSGTNTGDQSLAAYLTSAGAASTYLPLAGGTLTGDLTLSSGRQLIGTESKISLSSGGGGQLAGYVSTTPAFSVSIADGFRVNHSLSIGWANFGTGLDAVPDLRLYRGGAGILQQRNGTSPQTFQITNTYTSATSFGLLDIRANAAQTAYEISSFLGSAGGANLPINIGHRDSAGTFTSALSVATSGDVSLSRIQYASQMYSGIGATNYQAFSAEGIRVRAGCSFGFVAPGGGIGGTADTWIVQNSVGSIGLKTTSSADAALTCGAITASGTIITRNGTSPTSIQITNTYTSATSFGLLDIRANAAQTAYEISSFLGSAGGANLPINIGHRDSAGTFTSALSVGVTGRLLVVNPTNSRTVIPIAVFAASASSGNSVTISGGINNGDPMFIGTNYYTTDGELRLGTYTSPNAISIKVNGLVSFIGQVTEVPPASVTLATNGQFSIEMTSNTAGNLVYRGSDGTTRRAALVFV
jgi:hypothetical protein